MAFLPFIFLLKVGFNMRRLPFILSLFFFYLSPVGALEYQTQNLDIEILKTFGFEAQEENSLEVMNAFAQKNFLRPKNAERLSKQSIQHYKALLENVSQEQKEKLLAMFKASGVLKEVLPTIESPDYILIMGSTIPSMRSRIMFLDRLVREGKLHLHPKTKLVFLTGDRPLFKSETKEILLNPAPFPRRSHWKAPEKLPDNERDLSPFLWGQLALSPQLLHITPLHVKALKKKNTKRATTADTVEAFVHDYNPQSGSVLVISENPFIMYQCLVSKTLFLTKGLTGFAFEGAGIFKPYHDLDQDVRLGVLLDNLARTLYQRIKLAYYRSR